MTSKTMGFQDIQRELTRISEDVVALIRQYGMTAQSPLDVLADAKKCITNQEDYIRFLELSLEGRILGEIGDAMIKRDGGHA